MQFIDRGKILFGRLTINEYRLDNVRMFAVEIEDIEREIFDGLLTKRQKVRLQN